MPSTTTVKGTKVSSATSFVMSMELTKLMSTSSVPMLRTLAALTHRTCAILAKSPAPRSPAITVIRQYSSASVRKLMYPQ